LNDDGDTGENKSPEAQTETPKDDSSKPKEAVSDGESDASKKKKVGWPSRPPFENIKDEDEKKEKDDKAIVHWNELTWKEQNAWRVSFLRGYLKEIRNCLPFVRKLFFLIYRISPWRAVVFLAMNVIKGLLPAITLRTRGDFIMMVSCPFQHC
jgi:hypothetical protein